MGKTVTSMKLAQRLLDERQIPCIYIDLRLIGKIARSDIRLHYILNTAIEKNINTDPEAGITADMIIHAVQRNRALIIFDGLDEVGVHLEKRETQEFIRELWRVLPVKRREHPGAGKMIIACRSHFFRDTFDQNELLSGEGREQISTGNYRGYMMLPFDDDQIRQYLACNFPDRDTRQLIEMPESVHNLSELSRRPFNLSMIREVLPQIEQRHPGGERVESVTLYQDLMQAWLTRDNGKHLLDP